MMQNGKSRTGTLSPFASGKMKAKGWMFMPLLAGFQGQPPLNLARV